MFEYDEEEARKIMIYLNCMFINTVEELKLKFEKLKEDKQYFAFKSGERYEQLFEKDNEIKTLKKALELACDDLRNLTKTYYKTTKQLSREYKILAKENKNA